MSVGAWPSRRAIPIAAALMSRVAPVPLNTTAPCPGAPSMRARGCSRRAVAARAPLRAVHTACRLPPQPRRPVRQSRARPAPTVPHRRSLVPRRRLPQRTHARSRPHQHEPAHLRRPAAGHSGARVRASGAGWRPAAPDDSTAPPPHRQVVASRAWRPARRMRAPARHKPDRPAGSALPALPDVAPDCPRTEPPVPCQPAVQPHAARRRVRPP